MIEDGLIAAGDPPTACLDSTILDPAVCEGPPIIGVAGSADSPALLAGSYLARISNDRVQVVAVVAGFLDPRYPRIRCDDDFWIEGEC